MYRRSPGAEHQSDPPLLPSLCGSLIRHYFPPCVAGLCTGAALVPSISLIRHYFPPCVTDIGGRTSGSR
ncbi:hypothetical protein RRG08_003364 [Elysia crispata]|uniref:Uncharacterized protein n=1 Tax=Elysia crispata TaxID=231223 RepID=A0AAE1B3F8_9GAST|nr:hypothetical protein RRG08_003364 [Elysia crispata]